MPLSPNAPSWCWRPRARPSQQEQVRVTPTWWLAVVFFPSLREMPTTPNQALTVLHAAATGALHPTAEFPSQMGRGRWKERFLSQGRRSVGDTLGQAQAARPRPGAASSLAEAGLSLRIPRPLLTVSGGPPTASFRPPHAEDTPLLGKLVGGNLTLNLWKFLCFDGRSTRADPHHYMHQTNKEGSAGTQGSRRPLQHCQPRGSGGPHHRSVAFLALGYRSISRLLLL